MNNNKLVNVLLIIFIVSTLVLSGYIMYDKMLDDEVVLDEPNIIDNNVQDNVDNNKVSGDINDNIEKYNYDVFAEKVYAATGDDFGITLWANKTYSYYNDEGINYFGTYTIVGDVINLLVLSGTNSAKEEVIPKEVITKSIKIISEIELLDVDSNITLIRVNQPSRAGGYPKDTFN